MSHVAVILAFVVVAIDGQDAQSQSFSGLLKTQNAHAQKWHPHLFWHWALVRVMHSVDAKDWPFLSSTGQNETKFVWKYGSL